MAASLTGFWTGHWVGDPPDIPSNSFETHISDASGALSGEMIEPDDGAESGVLRAHLSGVVAGHDVHFLKIYDGESYAAHGVDYHGRVDEAGTLIAGEWSFAHHSGVFEMRREVSEGQSISVDQHETVDT